MFFALNLAFYVQGTLFASVDRVNLKHLHINLRSQG